MPSCQTPMLRLDAWDEFWNPTGQDGEDHGDGAAFRERPDPGEA